MTGKADAARALSQRLKDRINTVVEGVMAHLRDGNAEEILGPGLSPLIGRGSLRSIVTFALYADVLRMVRDMVMADGTCSDKEVQESLGLLSVIAAAFAQVRSKDYTAYKQWTPQPALAFLLQYETDAGVFGYANKATEWAGVTLCRNIQRRFGVSDASDLFGSSLVAWAEAIAAADPMTASKAGVLSSLGKVLGLEPEGATQSAKHPDASCAEEEADALSPPPAGASSAEPDKRHRNRRGDRRKRAQSGTSRANAAEQTRGAASRTVRIFISSTFRDFAGERDLLVRKVFPELRRRCRERQVELVDVDLRWGITEAEAEQGRVLPICLAEIDRARPFFMGLLGERYGWVPAASQFHRSLLIEQPWLEQHAGGKSVTELEILHGVLNNPEMAGRAFFYFRDPAWAAQRGGDHASEGETEQRKLTALKDRIRTSGFSVVEDYPDPEALAERVRKDLWSLIDAAYPEADVPDSLTLERRRHEAYGSSRMRLYLGGKRYFDALDEELAAESPRPVLVCGRSGGGKSALVANWLARWSQVHPNTAVIVHHLGCGADAADPVRMAVRIIQEIASLVGSEFKPTSDPDKQLDELATWLATASAWAERTGRTVLIVLDGLDKLADRRHLRWFPTVLPTGVRLVASCLDGEVLKVAAPKLPWRELRVEPFAVGEQTRFIDEYLGRFRKQLTADQTRLLQSHPLVSNPLFLLTVLEELRVFGVHEELDERLTTLLSPPPSKQLGEEPTVDDVFEHVLARIEDDHGREPVQKVMEAIWASRAGLYTDEILAIAEVPPATWAGIANALDESLYESSGRINFGHDYLRKAVEDRYAIAEDRRIALHRRLVKYFNAMLHSERLFYESLPADFVGLGHDLPRETALRIAEELPWQCKAADDIDELGTCLCDRDIFSALHFLSRHDLLGYWLWLGAEDVGYEDISEHYQKAYAWVKDSSYISADKVHAFAWNVASFLTYAGYSTSFVELLHQELYRFLEQSVGVDHPDTLSSIGSLATLLMDQGDYAAAEPLCRQALSGFERTLGPDHPQTLSSVNSLANCLSDQGDAAAAEPLYRRVLAGRERALGPDHPDTLSSIGNLAKLLFDQGDYAAAEPLFNQVFWGFEKVLGSDHPNTLQAVSHLGSLDYHQGDYESATDLHRRALSGQEKLLGPNHPDTLSSVVNLAMSFMAQGAYTAAEPLCRRAVAGFETLLGPDHPLSLKSVNNLALLHKKTGEYGLAGPLYKRVLEGMERVLGPDHLDTLEKVSHIADLHMKQGDSSAAEPLFRRALAGFEAAVGPDHATTLAIAHGLIDCIMLRNLQMARASDEVWVESVMRQVFEDGAKVVREVQEDAPIECLKLGRASAAEGRFEEASGYFALAIDAARKSLGVGSPMCTAIAQAVANEQAVLAHRHNAAIAAQEYESARKTRRSDLIAQWKRDATPAKRFIDHVPVPAGEFTIGSPEKEQHRSDDENQVKVRISQMFEMGRTVVTQGQWRAVMETAPWLEHGLNQNQCGDAFPAVFVTWDEAVEFCQTLTELERHTGRLSGTQAYRLPTEAEWEYACRAGTTRSYSFGDDIEQFDGYGWCGDNAAGQLQTVAGKKPNPWGLCDMHGNVWEWCADLYATGLVGGDDPVGPRVGGSRVVRGGSFRGAASYCRSACRRGNVPSDRRPTIGFRLVCSG